MFDHLWRTTVFGEDVSQQLQSPRELPVEDPMWAVRLRQWPPLIHDFAPQVSSRELVFHLAHPRDVGVAKEVTDHGIGESAPHEIVDD